MSFEVPNSPTSYSAVNLLYFGETFFGIWEPPQRDMLQLGSDKFVIISFEFLLLMLSLINTSDQYMANVRVHDCLNLCILMDSS